MLILVRAWLVGIAHARAERSADEPKLELRSRNGRYAIQLTGFIQARYRAALYAGELDESLFLVRRACMEARGHVLSENVRYSLDFGVGRNRKLEFKTAYLEWRALSALRLRAGVLKVPMVREWEASSRDLTSLERSLVTDALGPRRSYGAQLSGKLLAGYLEYEAGILSGTDFDEQDEEDVTPAVVGRLLVHPLGRSADGWVAFEGGAPALSLGVSALWDRHPIGEDAAHRYVDDLLAGMELAARLVRLDLQAEYLARRRVDGPAVRWAHGGYLRACYYLARIRSSLTGRFSALFSEDEPIRWALTLNQIVRLDSSTKLDSFSVNRQIPTFRSRLPSSLTFITRFRKRPAMGCGANSLHGLSSQKNTRNGHCW